MKKNPQKSKPQPKTKIQLKIKSKNVTNNFILTPRTASIIDQRDNFHKIDKFTQEIKSEKERREDSTIQRANKETKRPEYRMVSTDHPKITTTRKKFDDDETGTHTPLLKRVSFNSEIGNKKKSTQSLINTERVKAKRKNSSKLSNSASGELNKSTLQRLIGVIIKDYKEGKLKQRQLEQTLMELYDRKQKKKSLGKTKKRKDLFSTFSNEFIKSSHQIRSQALTRKLKKSDQIHQSVLQGRGIVNKIIIKGITTSLFLKEDAQLTNIKQSDTKTKNREPSYQINTSNSIKEIYDDMVNIKEHILSEKSDLRLDLKNRMAIKIQRAWRRYKTKKILSQISRPKNPRRDEHPFHILDEFTDEQNDEAYHDSKFTRNIVRPDEFETQSKQYSELVNIISNSLHEKKLSKEECLKKILRLLHYPQQLIQTAQKQKDEGDENVNDKIESVGGVISEQEHGKASRVIIFNDNPLENMMKKQDEEQSDGDESNQLNSFTNKYSSREVNKDHRQYFAPEQSDTSQLDNESLTFVHSQTAANQSFKMINIQNIQEGLKGREQSLQLKKEKQLQELTEKLFMKKISKQQYLKQKEKTQKWFKSKQKELKKIKNSLLKSCMDAKNILENDSKILTSEKSKKMLKCLSDKYIKKQDWTIKDESNLQEIVDAGEHLPCEQNEFQLLDVGKVAQTNNQTELNDEDQITFDQNDALKVQWQSSKGYEISPKLSRHTSLDQNQYKYEQIQRVIEEDDDNLEEGLGRIQNKQLESDKFIDVNKNNEDYISAQQISLINNYVNETTKRFKYLCTEDKQDIFQFLFLDMVLEMFTESYPGQNKVLRAAETYINKAKRLRKIPKGIKTNLVSCKEYLRVLYQFVSKEENSLKGLSIPMGPSAAQMLRYMRDQIIEAQDDETSSALVLPVAIFERLGKTKELELKLERYYDDEQRETARVAFLKTALHINNKALFDSLNQMLDHERPYGVWGKPFPWKKTLSIDKKWTRPEQQKKLRVSIDKTIECCSYLCGILTDKQDSLFGNHRVSQEYVMQIRQDRLSKMLANDLIENQERWIFYDDEQTEILMEASAFITKKLIKELVLQLMSLMMKI